MLRDMSNLPVKHINSIPKIITARLTGAEASGHMTTHGTGVPQIRQ